MSNLQSIPAAKVNGDTLSLHDVLTTLKVKGKVNDFVRETITDHVIAQAAAKEGITATAEELQTAADQFRSRAGLNKADATQQWLTAMHMSEDDFEAGLERNILTQKMIGRVADDHMEAHFNRNRARFDRAELSRIVVREEDLASELLTQISEEGVDFAELATEHSIEPFGNAAKNQSIIVHRNQLPKEVETAVFGAKPGDILGPFAVGQTWQLIKVEKLLPGALTPQIAAILRKELFQDWLRDQTQAANVDVLLHAEI